MATLLFLGASISQLAAIRHARDAGHRVVAVDGNPRSVAFAAAHVGEAVDFADVDAVREVARRHRVDGVLAVSSDRAVAPAAVVAESLGLPSIGPAVACVMTNKLAMRGCLAAAAVAQPLFAGIDHSADAAAAVAHVGLPAVLKPVDSGGQRGLFLVKTVEELERRLPETLALSRSGQAIIESFLPGEELNCLVVVRDGIPTLLTLSDRLRPDGPGFGVGWIHLFPSSQSRRALAEAREVAYEAVRALGLRDGVAFPQLLVGRDGRVRVVEVAARIPAGQMADLVRLGTGIDLYDIAIAQALGEQVPDERVAASFERPIAIRFLTADPGVLPLGVVASISGIDEMRGAPGVLAADLYFGVGDRITALKVDADRLGFVAATGLEPAAALALADAAAKRLSVRTAETVVTPGAARLLIPAWIVPFALLFAFVAGTLGPSSARARVVRGSSPLRSGRVRRQFTFGRSERGRSLKVFELGDPRGGVRVLVVGCRHGNEPAGIAIAVALICRATPVSGGHAAVLERFADLVGRPLIHLPRYPGSAVSWSNHARHGTASFVVELPQGRLPAAAVSSYIRAVAALAAGPGRSFRH